MDGEDEANRSMNAKEAVLSFLRAKCKDYRPDLVAILRRTGTGGWPLQLDSAADLEAKLSERGHLVPLPQEPAALANVLEVLLVDHLIAAAAASPGVSTRRGTERSYPDLELSGAAFGGGHHAIDIKVARRNKSGRATQSKITLYTGNTFFRYPRLPWPSIQRPFEEYVTHIDVIAVYTLNRKTTSRVDDFEVIVQEPWRIASKQRSSTTREYLGAVQNLDALRNGRGEFATEAEFYEFWRKYPFKIGRAVQKQLDKLLAQSDR